MKLYMSVDIEGTAGISNWDEADNSKRDYPYFAEEMSREAAAAAAAAVKCGADEVVVRDAHASARNMNPLLFPEECTFIRGWSGHPHSMMDGIDSSYDACMLVGYHSRAGSADNPLSHSFSSSRIFHLSVNDRYVSEYYVNMLTAAYYGVPLIVLCGDEGLCKEAKQDIPGLYTVATASGEGDSTHSLHPLKATRLITEAVESALSHELPQPYKLPEHFKVQVEYKNHPECYKKSFYPGASSDGSRTLTFETDNWFEALRFLHFAI